MTKFRAWDKKNKSFITNDDEFKEYMIGLDGKFYRMDFYSGVSGHENGNLIWNELKDIILMQWTGLKDKNDKEIYEGDLILYKYYRDNGYKERKFEEVGYIKILQGAAFILKSENDTPSDWGLLWSRMNNSDTKAEISIEVIGNVYKNPELIGGKNG